jgi:GntR family transcriptional regulator, carbon starvation induced regulator
MARLPELDQSVTQTDRAYAALHAEILSCRLAPGTKINISEVAAKLGFSPGAVREALSRLGAEKMTVATAQKGYSVAKVSIDELKDLTHTRITIEQLCLASAIQHGDVEWETAIVAAYHRLHRLPVAMPGDPSRLNAAWAAAHTTFHAALAGGCNSPWLLTLRAMLYAQTERYRHLSVALAREDRDVDAEHKTILDACLARDSDLACKRIDDHLARTTSILLTSPLLLSKSSDTQSLLANQQAS